MVRSTWNKDAHAAHWSHPFHVESVFWLVAHNPLLKTGVGGRYMAEGRRDVWNHKPVHYWNFCRPFSCSVWRVSCGLWNKLWNRNLFLRRTCVIINKSRHSGGWEQSDGDSQTPKNVTHRAQKAHLAALSRRFPASRRLVSPDVFRPVRGRVLINADCNDSLHDSPYVSGAVTNWLFMKLAVSSGHTGSNFLLNSIRRAVCFIRGLFALLISWLLSIQRPTHSAERKCLFPRSRQRSWSVWPLQRNANDGRRVGGHLAIFTSPRDETLADLVGCWVLQCFKVNNSVASHLPPERVLSTKWN